MIFKRIDINSYKDIKPFIEKQATMSCDYSFGILYIWGLYFNYEYAIEDDILFLKENNEEVSFLMPIGSSLQRGLFLLEQYCSSNNIKLIINAITEDYIKEVCEFYNVDPLNQDIWNDYIYDIVDLSTYSGNKMQKKRNRFNKFIKEHPNYSTEIISKDNIDEVKNFFLELISGAHKDNDLFVYEKETLPKILDQYFNLPFIGMVLKIDKQIVAFTIGEVVNDVLVVHVEKSLREIDSSFSAIQKFFTEYCNNNFNIKYVNREDDAGDEGLKKSKLSYKPIRVMKKYRIEK